MKMKKKNRDLSLLSWWWENTERSLATTNVSRVAAGPLATFVVGINHPGRDIRGCHDHGSGQEGKLETWQHNHCSSSSNLYLKQYLTYYKTIHFNQYVTSGYC